MNTEELKKYELMVIFSGDLTEMDFGKELDEVRKLLQESTSGISYESSWGKRDFTYRIKKQARGFYVVFNFAADPSQILELRGAIKLNPQILRHMLVTVPEEYKPGHHEEEVLPREQKQRAEDKKRAMEGRPTPRGAATSTYRHSAEPALQHAATTSTVKIKVAGKEEEEHLKNVEKKLEQILENPDIDIR